jgi:two-component system, chemotaxis family, protein-glutamate methylesterase/glutaminase
MALEFQMKPLRILVVDDSVVIRKLLLETLAKEELFEVVGSASDGRMALSKIDQLKPDLVTLDLEMPVMNGLETLAELRKSHPALPVIMFNTLTERGVSATLDALSLGAADYATKPSSAVNPASAIDAIQAELIPKIKAFCGVRPTPKFAPTLPRISPRSISRHPIEIVAIGTSTGGPNALAEVLPNIPKDLPVPIVVVQHMPPVFTRLLAERLATQSEIPISEGTAGQELVPGHAWVAPGNYHMTIARAGLRWSLNLDQGPPEHSCRPAVDVMFRSVAEAFKSRVLGVIMTGMGSDGVLGSRRIGEAGGQVIVQDEASSVIWGMPGLVYAAGQADGIYPLHQLAQEITRRVLQSRTKPPAVDPVDRVGMEVRRQ